MGHPAQSDSATSRATDKSVRPRRALSSFARMDSRGGCPHMGGGVAGEVNNRFLLAPFGRVSE